MTILNRLLAVLFLLLLLVGAVLTLGLVAGLLTSAQVQQVWPYAPALAVTRDLAHLSDLARLYVLGGAAVVALLALFGLLRELTPPPRRARTLVLHDAGPGYTELSYRTLDHLAAYNLERVAGVERARARVQPRRGALEVRCQTRIGPFADAAATKPAIASAVAEQLERVTGLPVRSVRVRTVVQETRRTRQRVR